ncbi:MAG: triose-phosphate isomerase [Anaeroplasma sp.]
MRKPMLAGNWKMNKTRDEAIQFVLTVGDNLPSSIDCVVCAPAIILRDLVKRSPNNLKIGAQNMHEKESGAFTGEISPVMLKDTKVDYVILGHSERRAYFNETDEKINLKVKKALEFDLKPIICVGEVLSEREDNKTNEVLYTQVTKALQNVDISNPENIIIAYEPVWAIGTGKSASSDIAEEACGYIRSVIAKMYSESLADQIRILYGGSVSIKNIKEYMSKPNVDGGLVGGASLDASSFIELCKACE